MFSIGAIRKFRIQIDVDKWDEIILHGSASLEFADRARQRNRSRIDYGLPTVLRSTVSKARRRISICAYVSYLNILKAVDALKCSIGDVILLF